MIEWRKLLEQTHPDFQHSKKPDEVEWILSTGTLKNRIENIPDRLGFKIGEVSDYVGVKQYVLRYWESEFNELQPKKSKKGQRIYTKKDMKTALAIKKLLHEDRFSIEGARAALKKLRKQIKFSARTDSGDHSPTSMDFQESHHNLQKPGMTGPLPPPDTTQTSPPLHQETQMKTRETETKTATTTTNDKKTSLETSARSLLESIRQARTSLNL